MKFEITCKLVLCFLVVHALLLPVNAKEIIKKRGGLANYGKMLLDSEKVKEWKDGKSRSCYFGGPFSCFKSHKNTGQLGSFYVLMSKYMKKIMPKRKYWGFSWVNNGPSWLGSFRVIRNMRYRSEVPTNLLFIDFAAYDRNCSPAEIETGMEGMIRQVRKKYPQTDILLLYSFHPDFLKDYQSGKTPRVIEVHEKLADHYQIPSVNFAKYLSDKIIAGEITLNDLKGENEYLIGKKGDEMCLQAIKPLLDEAKVDGAKVAALKNHVLPEKLSPTPIEAPQTVSYELAKLQPGWLGWQECPLENYQHVVKCDQPGPELTLRFKGNAVGFYGVAGPDSGNLEYSIDGSPWKTLKIFDQAAAKSYYLLKKLIAFGLDFSDHVLKIRVAPNIPEGSKGRVARIIKFMINGKALYKNPYAGMTSLQRIDKIYSGMEPLTYVPSEDRWSFLPKTIKRLNEGGKLTIVMLGDSIVSDTNRSNYRLLLGKLYPKCEIKVVRSVRGSTGCDWYQHENRVNDYVLKYKPDLLMIGGISNKGGVEPIRNVINQVKEKRPETEIMLMTGVFGRNQDPKKIKGWSSKIAPNGSGYRSQLKRLAAEEKVEFLDMRGLWGQYILDSKHPCGSFMRDPVHANDRGQQILGRIMEKFFAPKKSN